MFCGKCGNRLSEGEKYCGVCGNPVTQSVQNSLQKANMQEPNVPVSYGPKIPVSNEPNVNEPNEPNVPVSCGPSVPAAGAISHPEKGKTVPKKKLIRTVIIIAAAAVLIAAGLIIFITCRKQKKYEAATEALSAHEYAEAEEMFEELGNYKDSEELYMYCIHSQMYFEAEEYFDNGEFSDALKKYEALEGFADSDEKAELCRNSINYAKAESLAAEEKYEEAEKIFEELGDFKDSAMMAEFCKEAVKYNSAVTLFDNCEYAEAKQLFSEVTYNFNDLSVYIEVCEKIIGLEACIQDIEQGNYGNYTALPEIDPIYIAQDSELSDKYDKWSRYYDAVAKLNSGAGYQAKVIFDELDGLGNSEALAEQCVMDEPKTGEYYRNTSFSGTAVSLKIVFPDDGTKNVIKIYTKGGTLVCTAYIRAGSSITINLPAGTYMVKNGYSSGNWYGKEDMFGPKATYNIMTFDGTEYFELKNGYTYTMSLRVSGDVSGDPVGTKKESWGTF